MHVQFWLKITGALGFLGVALGAFGGHVLDKILNPKLFEIFQVGIQYHFIHTLALLSLVLLGDKYGKNFELTCRMFLAGVICFSGSLYIYSLTEIRFFSWVTPVGGLLFLGGWLKLAFSKV